MSFSRCRPFHLFNSCKWSAEKTISLVGRAKDKQDNDLQMHVHKYVSSIVPYDSRPEMQAVSRRDANVSASQQSHLPPN